MKSLYPEHRCNCGHLLFKGLVLAGSKIEIKCKKCGSIVSLGDQDPSENENSHFAILFDSKGNIVSSSSSTHKILGYTEHEIKRITIFDLAKKSNPESYTRLWETIHRNMGRMFFFDGTFTSKTGKELDFRCKFRTQKHGNQSFLMVFYSTQDQFSNGLPEETEIPPILPIDSVIEIDKDSTVLYTTRPLTEKLGIKHPADGMGIKLDKLMKIQGLPKLLTTRKTFLLKNQSFLGKNEKVDLIFTPLYNPDNQIKGYKIIILAKKA